MKESSYQEVPSSLFLYLFTMCRDEKVGRMNTTSDYFAH